MSQRQFHGNAGGSNFDNNRYHGLANHDVGRGGRPFENNGGRGGRGGGGGRGGRPHESNGGRGGGGRTMSGSRYWSPKRKSLERDGMMVQTNCYQLVTNKDYAENATINQYAVTIDALVRKRDDEIKDSTYAPTPGIDDQTPRKGPFYLVKKTFHTEVFSESDDRSTKLSRRILNHCNKKLQETSRPLLIYDGTNVAYSRFGLIPVDNKKLYTEYHETYELRDNDQDNEHYQESAAKKQKKDDVIEYIICINMNADDDDADATVRKGWYLVSFRHVSDVSMSRAAEGHAMLPLVNCINTALKGNMISHCVGFGRSPYMYFFQPPKEQEAILPDFLKEKLYNSIIPLLGLKQSVRYCSNSAYGLLLVADFGLRYMYNDINAKTKEPFHVLQVDRTGRATIANTVKIDSVDEHIPRFPPEIRKDLEKRLQKIFFHVRYYRGGVYQNKLKAQQLQQLQEAELENLTKAEPEEITGGNQRRKPLTDEQIARKSYFLKKNVRLFMANDGPSIIWEPETYTFPYLPKANTRSQSLPRKNFDSVLVDASNPEAPTQITVEKYFSEQYQCQLKYPKMPLIRIKSRHKDMKEYYPLEMLLQCQDEVKNMNTEDQIKDGLELCDTFCRQKRINKISEMLHGGHGGGSSNDPLQGFHNGQSEVLQQQFQLELEAKPIEVKAKVLREPELVSQNQGVQLNDGSLTLRGTFAVPSTISSFTVLNYCGEGKHDSLKRWFQDLFRYCSDRGMIVPADSDFDGICTSHNVPGRLSEMYDHFQAAIKKAQTHYLTRRRDGVNVQTIAGTVIKCGVELCDDVQFVNVWPNDGTKRGGISVNRVDCPSIVFIILPDDTSSQTYSNIKLLSHADFVVQSQVVLWSKASNQGKQQQYFSNLSYKLNLKLGTALGGEAAWKRRPSGWADEVPTLIIGISMASASGQDSIMTVVGTVLLDNIGLNHKQEMCVQEKGPLVDERAMIAIIKALGIAWSQSNKKQIPERVVIYRSTGDDGMFEDIIGKELKAVKKAFHELNKSLQSYHCSNCDGSSCILCLPKITMAIAQSQHNIIIAPSATIESGYNVPSGTCLEGLFPALSLTNNDKMGGLFDELKNVEKTYPMIVDSTAFALVSQGGLKGTSKCVIYRVIWNENISFMSSPKATQLTLDKIQYLTYHLSFQYGTAPKAPRLPIVLQYSNRLNKIAIGYIHIYYKDYNDPEAVHDPKAVLTNILGRVRNEKTENLTIPLHTSSMG